MKNQVLQFLMPNEANGYKIIQLAGWTGKCLIVPRTELKEIGKRSEAKDPGIYFLFGENEDSTSQKLYIGESERFYDRLLNHDNKKDFWNSAIIFTGGLDKAKVKYLEFLSTSTAISVNRYNLTNTVSPKGNSLSEFDMVIAQDYFNKIKYILEVLNFPVFQDIKNLIFSKDLYYLNGENFQGNGQLLSDGSINVLAGSIAKLEESKSFGGWSKTARMEFCNDGTFVKQNDSKTFLVTRNVLFKSPSAAAATLSGRSINGWTAWKDKDGNTLDENLRK